MLQYGFFNPVHMDAKENMYKKVRDSLMAKEMVDAQNAYYDFVSEKNLSLCHVTLCHMVRLYLPQGSPCTFSPQG